MDKKDFKPHMMYDPKTGKGYMAKTYADHLKMDKMGYTHDKPEMKSFMQRVWNLRLVNHKQRVRQNLNLEKLVKMLIPSRLFEVESLVLR